MPGMTGSTSVAAGTVREHVVSMIDRAHVSPCSGMDTPAGISGVMKLDDMVTAEIEKGGFEVTPGRFFYPGRGLGYLLAHPGSGRSQRQQQDR